LLNGLQVYSNGVRFVVSNVKRGTMIEVLGTSSKSQGLLRGKLYSQYENLKQHPQFFLRYFTKSSATFHKLMVLLGPSLALQDTRMMKVVLPED
jgi:NhaP-type Na+/H+ and K+/H+ antiporter